MGNHRKRNALRPKSSIRFVPVAVREVDLRERKKKVTK